MSGSNGEKTTGGTGKPYNRPGLRVVDINDTEWRRSIGSEGTGREFDGGGRGGGSDGGGEMDKRLTVLETHVSHMNTGISEIKTDIRDLKSRELILILAAIGALATVYFAIDSKIGSIDHKVTNQSENITKQFTDLKTSIDKLIKAASTKQDKK